MKRPDVPGYLQKAWEALHQLEPMGAGEVFADACKTAATEITQSTDRVAQEEADACESMHSKYQFRREAFQTALSEMLDAVLENPLTDVLGELYMLANANQERQGQYFTPGYVSDADARMIVGLLKEREVVNIGDISCGSGVQLLSAAAAASWIGEDPGRRLFLTGADLNPLCADMCYLQLTLNGLSAAVFHSDTLAGRVYDGRVTPRAIAMAAGKQQRLDRTSMTGRFDLLLQGRKLAGTAGA